MGDLDYGIVGELHLHQEEEDEDDDMGTQTWKKQKVEGNGPTKEQKNKVLFPSKGS